MGLTSLIPQLRERGDPANLDEMANFDARACEQRGPRRDEEDSASLCYGRRLKLPLPGSADPAFFPCVEPQCGYAVYGGEKRAASSGDSHPQREFGTCRIERRFEADVGLGSGGYLQRFGVRNHKLGWASLRHVMNVTES